MSLGDFLERMTGWAKVAYYQDKSQRERADRDLRRFLFLLLGRLLLGTKGNDINYRFLSLLEDLD